MTALNLSCLCFKSLPPCGGIHRHNGMGAGIFLFQVVPRGGIQMIVSKSYGLNLFQSRAPCGASFSICLGSGRCFKSCAPCGICNFAQKSMLLICAKFAFSCPIAVLNCTQHLGSTF